MDSDPYISAVVWLRRGPTEPEEATVENPGGVTGEGAAILAGSAPSGPTSGGKAVSPTDVAVPAEGGAIARSKAYFTKAGFEVHAPLGATFSIGNRKSRFEKFFDQELLVDEERLGAPVTTLDGDRALPLAPLPEEIREMVESITLPSPDLFGSTPADLPPEEPFAGEEQPDEVLEDTTDDGLADKVRHSGVGVEDPNIVGDVGPTDIPPGTDPDSLS